MKRTPWLIPLLILALALPAHAEGKRGGLGLSYAVPDGAFEDVADAGVGVALVFDYPFTSSMDLTASIGRYDFGGADGREDIQPWEFTAGPQIDIGRLYAGVELGYFTEVDEAAFVPNLGLRRGLLDVSLRYKSSGDANFYAARLAFFF